MRKITAYAGLISVPTMVAGIYGMNFDFMPELHWRFGYPLILLLAGALVLHALPQLPPEPLALVSLGGVNDRQFNPLRRLRRPAWAEQPPTWARRQARADPGRAGPGAGAAVRGLVRDGRKPGGAAGAGVRAHGRGPRAGGLAHGDGTLRWGPAPARTWAPRSATRPCTTATWSAAGTAWPSAPADGRAGGRCPLSTTACWPGCASTTSPDGPVTDAPVLGPRPPGARPRRRRHRDRPLRAGGRDRQPARPVARRVAAPVLVRRAHGALRPTAGLPTCGGPLSRRGDVHASASASACRCTPRSAAPTRARSRWRSSTARAPASVVETHATPLRPDADGPTAHGGDRGRGGALRPARLRVHPPGRGGAAAADRATPRRGSGATTSPTPSAATPCGPGTSSSGGLVHSS